MSGAPELSKVPEAEQKVLLRALSKEPNERFPSCAEFVQGLREVIEPRPVKEEAATGRMTGPRWVMVFAALLVAVVLARYFMTNPTKSLDKEETAVKTVSWLPDQWAPASPDEPIVEDRNTNRYFRQISRTFDGQTVTMVVVPHRAPTDPPTFYMMRDKVWNDLFKVYRNDPGSKTFRDKCLSFPGCSRFKKQLEGNEWTKGAWAGRGAVRDLGVDGKDRGRIPVFRVCPVEGECMAEWMGGRLPRLDQYQKAAGISEDKLPAVFDGSTADLPLNPPDGPWPIDRFGRDENAFGCRQLMTNGKEYTRSLFQRSDELPLKDVKTLDAVHLMNKGYLSPLPPSVEELTKTGMAPCDSTDFDSSFRVVLER
jgi:hypothetical protein